MSKEIYAPVGGKAQKITKLYAPVNGVARNIKKAYRGVNGIARQVFEAGPPIYNAFYENTWESVIYACQTRRVPASWYVGDQLTMTIDGKIFLVGIIGKNHDTYADGSGKAPLTFRLYTAYNPSYPMNSTATNVGGWHSSTMRTATLPAILAKMPSAVQAAIKPVKKLTSAGDRGSNIITSVDKLFLLSAVELLGEVGYSAPGEGTQYAYYAAGYKKNQIGLDSWTRSPVLSANNAFQTLTASDGYSMRSADWLCPISFAFCF